jgi:hypothetical protein
MVLAVNHLVRTMKLVDKALQPVHALGGMISEAQSVDWIDETSVKRYLFIFGMTLLVFYLFLVFCLLKYGIE